MLCECYLFFFKYLSAGHEAAVGALESLGPHPHKDPAQEFENHSFKGYARLSANREHLLKD